VTRQEPVGAISRSWQQSTPNQPNWR